MKKVHKLIINEVCIKMELEFGQCLNMLLVFRGWSASKLAKEINVDPSYVRRWVRGERTPSLQSEYINKISHAFLHRNQSDSYKANFINELNRIGIYLDKDKDFSVLLKEVLKTSQIYSLSLNKASKKSETNEKDILGLLECIKTHNTSDFKKSHSYNLSIKKDTIMQFISGRENVLSSFIMLLKKAANNKTLLEKEIYITFQSKTNYFEGIPELYSIWTSIIRILLENGWTIHYLYRLNKNTERSLKLVKEIIEWCGFSNKFFPSYFVKYGIENPPADFIIVKGLGAMHCFGADSNDFIDRAFFYDQPESIDAIYKHVMKMYCQTRNLMTMHNTIEKYWEVVTNKDSYPGDLFVQTSELYSLTIPISLWKKYIDRSIENEYERKLHLERLDKRIKLFYQDIIKYKVRYFVDLECLLHMIKTGQYLYFNEYQKPELEDIYTHLQYIIYLLETYENFELGILTEKYAKLFQGVHWEVKSDTVIISTFDLVNNNYIIHYTITEETMANAFHDYYLELWEQIPPKYKDKELVIAWFKEQAQWYKSNILNI